MSATEDLTGMYHQYKGQIKERFGDIADDEFERASGSLESLVGMIQRKTGEARRTVEQFVKNLGNNASDTASNAASQIQDYAEQARSSMKEGYSRVASGIQEGMETTQATIRQRPVESIAVALGAGILVGAVLGLLISSRPR